MLMLVGCSDDKVSQGGRSTTTSAVPEMVDTTDGGGPPPGAVKTGLRELEAGQCFDTIDDPIASTRAVWAVDCEVTHSYEVYDVFPYAGDGAGRGGAYPGEPTVQNWAEQACYDRFEDFVGVRWTVSKLDIAVWWPSAESWGRSDRTVICTVMSDSGEKLNGTQRSSQE